VDNAEWSQIREKRKQKANEMEPFGQVILYFTWISPLEIKIH